MNKSSFKLCFPPEDVWIASILKGDTDKLPQSESEWKGVFERASSQNLAPLLLSALGNQPSESIPSAVLNEFKTRYLACLVRSERVRHELIKIINIFREEGIETVVVKGAALWGEVYGDIGARPVVDADILVRRRDVQKIHKLILGQGYRQISSDLEVAILSSANYLKGIDALIDFRWDMTHNDHLRFIGHLSADDIFERSTTSSIGGVEINIPSVEDQLLIAAFHTSVVHHFVDLRWLYDLLAIIGRYAHELDWAKAASLARRYHLETALYYSLHRADLQFDPLTAPKPHPSGRGSRSIDSKLPLSKIEELKPSKIRIGLLNLVEKRKWNFILELLLLDCFTDMIKYLFGILFPSRAWLKFHYKAERFMVLYHIVHPPTIAAKALKRAAWAALR